VSERDLHYQFWSLKQELKCLIDHSRCSSPLIILFTCYFPILITHTSSLMCRLILIKRDWSFESWRVQLALMAPSASSRRRKKRRKGEWESSREAELGAQSPQYTGAQALWARYTSPFLFDLNFCLDLRMSLVHDCLCELYTHKPYKWAPSVS
jgi:hypothetical protein